MKWVNTKPPQPDEGGDAAWTAFSEMLAGTILYGGLGWVGDHFLGTGFLLPIGVLLGLASALFLIYKRHASTGVVR